MPSIGDGTLPQNFLHEPTVKDTQHPKHVKGPPPAPKEAPKKKINEDTETGA